MQQTPGMRTPTALQASGETGITTPLFRKEAIAASATQRFGDVLGAGSLGWPTLLAMLPCVALLLWLGLGSYTRIAVISGALVPRAGQVSVTSLQPGEVVGRRAAEGSIVRAGAVLFELRSARSSARRGPRIRPSPGCCRRAAEPGARPQLQQQRDAQRAAAARSRRQSADRRAAAACGPAVAATEPGCAGR